MTSCVVCGKECKVSIWGTCKWTSCVVPVLNVLDERGVKPRMPVHDKCFDQMNRAVGAVVFGTLGLKVPQ